jgi:cysteine desulfurase family protein (TIGR01976 family)
MPSTAAQTEVRATGAIRADFPALSRQIDGRPVAYFDGPGGTQVPRAVADAVRDYLLHHNANTHWRYPTSEETDRLIADARRWLGWFLNAQPGEISFGANMTTITFHAARALGRGWSRGDEVVVTELDHHANVAPWMALARERGLTVKTARMDPAAGTLDWAHLESLVGPRTKLLALGAASNALGTINPVRRAADLVHAVRGLLFVDAVHYAPHQLVDVEALGCDLLACSAYKFYGPHIGVLYGRRDLLAALDVPKLAPAPDTPPDRLETGTQNHEGIVGAARAVEYLASLAPGETPRERLTHTCAALHARSQDLVERLWEGLGAITGVTRYGPPPSAPRTPTISFAIDDVDPGDACAALAARGVFVSHGDFYATTVVERLGRAPAGLIRAGCACYTSGEDVERLIDGVQAIRHAALGIRQ